MKVQEEYLKNQTKACYDFKYQDYQKAITMKIQKLICLQDYLNTLGPA
jgi:hypothetical protein